MDNTLTISGVSVEHQNGFKELSAVIDGSVVRFRVPETFDLLPSGELFIGVALLEAMYTGSKIVMDERITISKALADRIKEIQSIYSCWNPYLKIVDVDVASDTTEKHFSGVGSFYSAGVDSSHTLLDNIHDITHLLMISSFDSADDGDIWQSRIQKQSAFAESIGKKLIPIETNVRDWLYDRRISWEFSHGLLLSSIGSALGLKRVYIPSSHTYNQLFPWGSHPLSDPMWSTLSTNVIHHGCHCRRGEKIEELLTNSAIMNNLQVCWLHTDKNCGKCSKCVRTMVMIHLLGGKTSALPALNGYGDLKNMKPEDEALASQLEDAIVLATKVGNKKVVRVLKRYYRRYHVALFGAFIDHHFLGGFLRNVYRKIRRPDWLNWRVAMESKTKWDE